MSKEAAFFIYLIERYAENKKTTAQKVLKQWDSLGLIDFIYGMYEIYHIERLENAMDDIDRLILEKEEYNMSLQDKNGLGEDWEFSEDFYKADGEKKELSLEDFMDDDSADLNAESGLSAESAAGGELNRVAEQVKQVIALSGQGRNAAEIAAALGETEQYISDIMVCVQAFPEDNPVAVARLIVMG